MYFDVGRGDSRVPDIFGISQYGVVYTGGHGRIAEHGGANPEDISVPLVVEGDRIKDRGTNDEPVETTQIAPTILKLLGLDPNALQAVQLERIRARCQSETDRYRFSAGPADLGGRPAARCG